MLSSDCKNLLFKTKEEFEEKYLKVYFKTKKEYEYKAWIEEKEKTVYRIEFSEDLLATGGNSSKKQEEYYTVVNEDGVSKLNINKYIGHDEINKEVFQNNIRIIAISRDVYLEYVLYNFRVENYTENNICLNSPKKIITVKDSNQLKYTAATWENMANELDVKSKGMKTITIKFLREYKPNFKEVVIEFGGVNLNSENVNNTVPIKIEIY